MKEYRIVKYLLKILLPAITLSASATPLVNIDSIGTVLAGCWRWDNYYGGFASLPPQPAMDTLQLRFNRDAQDSLNHTLSYWTYIDTVLVDSGRITIQVNPGYPTWYYMDDVLNAFLGQAPPLPPLYFQFVNDSIQFTHFDIADDFTYVFGRDSCPSALPTDTSYVTIDSVIGILNGCWRWDNYFGGRMGLPPTPATDDVRLEFVQDTQDSLNHTMSCESYLNDTLKFIGRCDVGEDAGYFTLSCGIFDSIGIVGEAPLYFDFQSDTLLFPQQQFLDGYVYAFVSDTCAADTVIIPPDTSVVNLDSIIGILNSCWKWDFYFGGFPGLPPTPAWMNVRVEFSQDGQDSAYHTVTAESYLNDTLQFHGKCDVAADTNTAGYYTLSCGLFDSIGIVGSPPVYFYFESDTLLFPQQQWVDGYVYGFLKTCVPDDTTGGDEMVNETDVSIFPNPASSQIMIDATGKVVGFSLYNAIGMKLLECENLQPGKMLIDISSFPDGLYFICFKTEAAALTKKFIIGR